MRNMSYIIGAVVVVVALWFGAKEWSGEDPSPPPPVATERPAPAVTPGKEPQVALSTPAEVEGPLGIMLADRVMGRADAPVIMEEFSSLTCPHCATFHREALPKIKAAYIDTGKVRLIYRDYPLGALAMAAAMLARCGEPERYFGFLEVLFRGQQSWATSKDPRKELGRVARFAGIGKAEFEACLNNEALLKGIQGRAAEAQSRFGIESTPTFLINGVKVAGALPFEDFQTVIEEALKSKK
jgi:protein-disulfide isomerase